jgi:subtilisin family serine protease
MKKFFTLLIVALLPFVMHANPIAASSITADLAQEMQTASSSDLLRINIRLVQQYDVSEFESLRQSMTRAQRRDFVVNELKTFASQTQHHILSELNALSMAGEVSNIQSLWIANVINCYATPAAIEQLSLRSDINRIDIDEERILIDPFDIEEVGETQAREITYNVSIMNVPEVWDMGFTGEGVVVAVLDTGVNYNHVDLASNMWTHPDFPFHGWNFTNNSNNPMDFHGHGTHCAGTVAGDGTAGSQTGMAPNATIMALQVLTSSGGGTESGVWAAIQFGVEYGADVLSLSLGWAHAWNPDRSSWRTTMNNALAAGVVAAVAVGNEGNQQGTYPIPSNVRTPGDCPAPWRHPDQPDSGTRSAVVSVGATNSSDAIANFSSRGPVTWQNISPFNDYPYNPGVGLIMPDVVAPGVNVKSCSHSNTSGYTTMSGTSMACPGVAGVMALILSKNPNVTPEIMSQILEETALPLSSGKSNVFGSGRVDALEAILNTPFMGPVYAYHSINDETGNNNGHINPSEFIQVNLALVNNSEVSFQNVEAHISTDSPYITMVNEVGNFGDFGPEETVELANAFSFHVADNIPGTYQIVFRIEATDGDQVWKSEFIAIAAAPRLVVQSVLIDDSQGNNNGKLDVGELVIINFQTINAGQMTALNPLATLTSSSPFVNIHNATQNIANIPPLGSTTASFQLSVSTATPIAEPVTLVYKVVSGFYQVEKVLNLRVSELVEDFEKGDFTSFEWVFSGSQPWTIVSTGTYEGSYSARSGNIGHNQFSQMLIQMEVAKPDSIEFMYRVSSQAGGDYLRFFIDNNMMEQWSGEVNWTKAKFAVDPGMRTLSWVYQKNASISQGSDAAWVDNILFPQPVTTTAFAGQDAIICVGQDFHTEAVVMNAAEISWQTSGDGSFSATDIADPVYTPGPMDIESGSVILGLYVLGVDELEKTDEMTLSINPPVDAFAGEDRAICIGSTLLIDGAYAENHESLSWHTSGTGQFMQLFALETTYVPSDEDYESGEVTITLIANGYGHCDDMEASFQLSFSPDPQVFVGEDQSVCSNMPVMVNAEVAYATALLWTTNGTGSFENGDSSEVTYHPSPEDIAIGSVLLMLTATGVEGCVEVTDQLNVEFIMAPTVEVSGLMEICQGDATEITLHLTGSGPWIINMGEGFEEITTDQSQYTLALNPNETTTYAIVSLLDGSGCPVADAAQFTINVLTAPMAPDMPAGPVDIDYVETTSSAYQVDEVALAESYQWQLTPETAGTMSANGTTVEISWNTDYIGQATLAAKAIGECGESIHSESLAITLKNTIGLNELLGVHSIVLYPNPSSGMLNLELDVKELQDLNITVTNQLGQKVHSLNQAYSIGRTIAINGSVAP